MRKHKLHKRIPTARFDGLALRRHHRLRGHAKRELRNEEPTQRIARDIHPFPERGRPQQYGAPGVPEALQQDITRLFAMHQQGIGSVKAERTQLLCGLAHVPMAGKERKYSAVAGHHEVLQLLHHRGQMLTRMFVGGGQISRHDQ